jgi:hypothetical protein
MLFQVRCLYKLPSQSSSNKCHSYRSQFKRSKLYCVFGSMYLHLLKKLKTINVVAVDREWLNSFVLYVTSQFVSNVSELHNMIKEHMNNCSKSCKSNSRTNKMKL